MQNKEHSTQQLLTAVETTNSGQPILSEKNILELIQQDKWQNIKDCLLTTQKFADQYNNLVTQNKDDLTLIDVSHEDNGQDLFDQNNRINWFIPNEYKQFDIEDYILQLVETPEQKQRVEQELTLFKSHAMMDVLVFLKYFIDTLRKNNTVWGVGRGSSVASYVLYLLGVHKVDSIKYNLDPTEFLR